MRQRDAPAGPLRPVLLPKRSIDERCSIPRWICSPLVRDSPGAIGGIIGSCAEQIRGASPCPYTERRWRHSCRRSGSTDSTRSSGAESKPPDLGRRARPARRQGRQPGRDDAHRRCRCRPASPSPPRPATPTSAQGEQVPRRACGSRCWRRSQASRSRPARRFGDPAQPAARLLPLRRQVLHARHDGHRAQHRPERRDRRRA